MDNQHHKVDEQNPNRRKSSCAADCSSPPSKLSRPALDVDDATLLAENMRRTQARYVYSLVVFASSRLTQANIHHLHPCVSGVRILGDNFVLLFDTEAKCLQAYKDLSAQKDLRVDYYKSNINQRQSDSKVNRLILMAQGMPESVNEERMQELFPNALKTFLSRPNGKTPYAVINFFDERDAYETFKQCEGYTVDGFSVDVHYAFLPKDDQLNKKEVYVYGMTGDVTLQQMREIFGNAHEVILKQNRRANDTAPFYVLARFENELDAANIFERVVELNSEDSDARVVAQYVKIKTQNDYLIHEDHNFLYHYSDSIAESLALPNRWVKDAQILRAKITGGLTPTQRKAQQKLRQKARVLEAKLFARRQSKDEGGGSDGQSDNESQPNATIVPDVEAATVAPYAVENLRDRTWELMNRWTGGSSREFIDFLLSGICDIIRDSSATNNNDEPVREEDVDYSGSGANVNYWSRMRASLETATAGDTLTDDRRIESTSISWRHPSLAESPSPMAERQLSPVSFFNNAPLPPIQPKRKSLLQLPTKEMVIDDRQRASLDDSVDRPSSSDLNHRAPPLLSLNLNDSRINTQPTFFRTEPSARKNSPEEAFPPRGSILEPLMSLRNAADNVIEELVAPRPRSLLEPLLSDIEDSAIGPKRRALLESLEMLSQADDRFSPISRFEPSMQPYAAGRGRTQYSSAAATAAANSYYANMAAYHQYYMQAMSTGQVAAPYLYEDYSRTAQSTTQQQQPPPPPSAGAESGASTSGFFNNAASSGGGSYNAAARTAAATAAAAATNRNYFWM